MTATSCRQCGGPPTYMRMATGAPNWVLIADLCLRCWDKIPVADKVNKPPGTYTYKTVEGRMTTMIIRSRE